jgi:uncharacterized delta-60 repeat protein
MARSGFLAIMVISGFLSGRAQVSWSPDPTFQTRLDALGSVAALAAHRNGTVLIGGDFREVGGVARSGCALLDANGKLVESFVPELGPTARVLSIAVQPDAKVLLTGAFSLPGAKARVNIVRLHPDGRLDEAFELPLPYIYAYPRVATSAAGQVYFGGFLNAGQLDILYLGSDGRPDRDYASQASCSWTSPDLALLPSGDGRIYVGGGFQNFRSRGYDWLVRLRKDGTLDRSFEVYDGFDGIVSCLALTREGLLLVGGYFGLFNGAVRPGLVRLEQTGALDLAFKPNAIRFAAINSLVSLEDGSVIAAGTIGLWDDDTRWAVIKLTPDGGIDSQFGRIPVASNAGSHVNSMLIGRDGRLWVGGTAIGSDPDMPAALRLLSVPPNPGEPVVPAIMAAGVATEMRTQGDGKVVLAGNFRLVNGIFRPGIARLDPDGKLDPQFAPVDARLEQVQAIATDHQGNVFAGVTPISAAFRTHSVLKYRSDGRLDPTFESETLDRSVRTIIVDPSGGVVLGGEFELPAELGGGGVVRLSPKGRFLADPAPRNMGLSSVFALQPGTGGSLFCGGNFGYGDPQSNPRMIARLNPNGSVDSTFAIADEDGAKLALDSIVTCLASDSQGRIVVGGWFQSVGHRSFPGIFRMFQDGRLDPSFKPVIRGFNIMEVLVDSLDRIIALGDFPQGFGQRNLTVVRLSESGMSDSSFPIVDVPVASIALQGAAVLASMSGGQPPEAVTGEIVRISPATAVPTLAWSVDPIAHEIELRPQNVTRQAVRLESSTDLKTWIRVGNIGVAIRIGVSDSSNSLFFRIVDE